MARLAQQEIFGPVLAIQPYVDEDDAATARQRDQLRAVGGDLVGRHRPRGALAHRLRCGQVKVNGVRTRDTLTAPFGGYGDSGLGRELGRFGLEEFLEVKAVLGV